MKKILITFFSFISFIALTAQTQISGVVSDNNGNPIPGANVIIKNSTVGSTTGFDGNYSFSSDASGEQILEASFMGYTSFKKTINLSDGNLKVDIVLQESSNALDEVVLTSSATFRTQKNIPVSISSVKQKEITRISPNSQADIIRTVPGITAEGGGGETATNVFVRGLPSGGQYVFNPLQYDGMPLMSTFGLNSSAHDVYARVDIGMKGVEFVRGGAAVLYGAGSVAGIINYTSKTGDSDAGNILNLEWADKGRLKTDFYSGGKLGDEDSNTYYAFTGFVRYDEGPIVTGLPTKGAQFRANIKQKFDKGFFTVSTQYIDDKAQFFMPLPLEGGTRERLTGNDGEDVYQLLSSHVADVSFNTAGGNYLSPVADGVYTGGGYVMGDFNYDLMDDLKFKSKVKYAKYKHNFALYIGGNGDVGPNGEGSNPISLSDYMGFVSPDNQGYTANFLGSSDQLDGSTLVINNLHIDRLRPMIDYSGEASLTKRIESDNGSHNITVGTYMARSEAEDVNYQYRVLSEFNNDPQLINLNYTDVGGNNVIYSEGGLYDRIGMTSNKYFAQNKTALFLTDEMIFDRWRFDVGFRYETTKGIFNNGSISAETVYSNPDLTSELSEVKYMDGSFVRANMDANDWAISLAGLYELNDVVNLYANFSKGYFFPQIRGFSPIADDITSSKYNSEKIYQGEAGAKIGSENLSGSIAAYYVTLKDRIKITQAITGGQLVDQTKSEQNTATIGLEANFDYKLIDGLKLRGTATYQNHEITKNTDEDLVNGGVTETNVGNKLARQPNFLGNVGFYYDKNSFDANISTTYTGKKYAADNNAVELDAINIMRLGAGYTMNFGGDEDSLRLGFSVFNLLNDAGVTEGNPRDVGQTEGAFFFGRPILPRRFFLTATFDF